MPYIKNSPQRRKERREILYQKNNQMFCVLRVSTVKTVFQVLTRMHRSLAGWRMS